MRVRFCGFRSSLPGAAFVVPIVAPLMLSCVLSVAAVSPAHAQTTQYTSEADFLAALQPGYYTETFNTGAVSNDDVVAFAGNGFGYTVTSGAGPGNSGVYSSGTAIGSAYPDTSVIFTFTTGNVRAVGGNFFQTDISDTFQAESVTLTLSNGTTVTYTPADTSTFMGFVSDDIITSLTFEAPTTGTFPTIDNLTVGTNVPTVTPPNAVPEPGAVVTGLAMAGTTGLGLVRGRLRRRSKTA